MSTRNTIIKNTQHNTTIQKVVCARTFKRSGVFLSTSCCMLPIVPLLYKSVINRHSCANGLFYDSSPTCDRTIKYVERKHCERMNKSPRLIIEIKMNARPAEPDSNARQLKSRLTICSKHVRPRMKRNDKYTQKSTRTRTSPKDEDAHERRRTRKTHHSERQP